MLVRDVCRIACCFFVALLCGCDREGSAGRRPKFEASKEQYEGLLVRVRESSDLFEVRVYSNGHERYLLGEQDADAFLEKLVENENPDPAGGRLVAIGAFLLKERQGNISLDHTIMVYEGGVIGFDDYYFVATNSGYFGGLLKNARDLAISTESLRKKKSANP